MLYLTVALLAVTLCYAQFSTDLLERGNKVPKASECDSVEKNGKAKVPTMGGSSVVRETCMQAKETSEDKWFKDTICALHNFNDESCEEGESAADCKKKNEEACEAIREQWLGKIATFPRPEIDTSNTREQTEASSIIQILDEPTWFDPNTPRADFSAAAGRSFCSFRQSNWQDETEFKQMIADTETIDASACGGAFPADFTGYPKTKAGMLYYMLDVVEEEFNGGAGAQNGAKPVMRKDIRTMKDSERKQYLKALHITECMGLTKIWGAIHASSPADMHSGPGFLPSHSVFMRIYELSLHRFGGLPDTLGMAIGGWPADSTLPRWHNGRIRFSAIWGDDYIGPIANQFIGSEELKSENDIFTSGKWKTPSMAAGAQTLERSFRNVESRGGYISPQDVWGAMAIEDPMDFGCNVERSLLHGGHHMVISGHMGNLLAASWDAAFFMHHGFVDCMFRSWQMQGEKSERATKDTYPEPSSSWRRHKGSDTAHWTKWTSPKDGKVKEITHKAAWEYRNSGRGSYQCLIPSLLPCSRDEDCGVQPGISRDEKRLYCAAAGVCSQYVETNAICRNEAGAFLPCRKTTDRCQYSPTLFGKYNNGASGSADQPEAWFCVHSPALECGANTSKGSCESAGCNWQDTTTGIQKCDSKVPAFGFGVVEESTETMQAMGSTFNFLDTSKPGPSGSTWTVSDQNGGLVKATVSAKLLNSDGTFIDSDLDLKRSFYGFGIDQRSAKYGPVCDDNVLEQFGDYNSQIDRNEAMEVVFSEPVRLESLNLGNFGRNDQVEIEMYKDGEIIVYQAFKTSHIVFGTSSDDGSIEDCPVNADGQPECTVDKIIFYHATAYQRSQWSSNGKETSNGSCRTKNYGVGFSVRSLTVTTVQSIKNPAGTPSTFNGFCTGAVNSAEVSDYDACADRDLCFMSPPPPGSNEVDVILVPGGTCAPKGWRPMIEFVESDSKLVAKYRTKCPCGAGSATVLEGAGMAPGGKRYRPLLDLYRVQDRLQGNDDANRKDKDATAASATILAPLAALIALVMAF